MKIGLMAYFQSTVLCRSVTKLCGSQVKLKRSGMEVKMENRVVKTAYKKLLSYPMLRLGAAGILITAAVYRLLLFLFYGDELGEKFVTGICLASGGLHIGVLLICLIRYVMQVQKAGRYLQTLPVAVQEQMENDLEMGDRLDDMYFTRDFLVVYQLRLGKKQGFACIPYTEIGGVGIKPNAGNTTLLDILSSEGCVLHQVFFPLKLSADQAAGISRKIWLLQSREQSVRTTEEEQDGRDRDVRQAVRKSLSGVPMAILDFVLILLFCASMGIAEHYRKKGKLLEMGLAFGEDGYTGGNGALLFWPNLQFYVVMYGGALLLLAAGLLFARRVFRADEDTRSERSLKVRILLFTAGELLFFLFIGGMYTADVHTWENMIQGFWMLF